MKTNQSLLRTRLRPIVVVALTVLAVAGLFQNCGTYVPLDNPLFATNSASTCLGASCSRDVNYLSLHIGNSDPILITRTTERAIDLGGYCDLAGFEDSKIYAELKSGTATILATYLTTAKCDANGRFRVLMALPATYNYDLAYTIVLTLRAVDAQGAEFDHPSGLNRREVSLLTAAP